MRAILFLEGPHSKCVPVAVLLRSPVAGDLLSAPAASFKVSKPGMKARAREEYFAASENNKKP